MHLSLMYPVRRGNRGQPASIECGGEASLAGGRRISAFSRQFEAGRPFIAAAMNWR